MCKKTRPDPKFLAILLERVRDQPAGFLNASQDHQTTGCMELINSLTPTVAMPDMTSAMA